MTIYILSVIAIIVTLLYLKKKITEISQNIENKVNHVKAIVTHPGFYINLVGRILLMQTLNRITKLFRR